jgi:thiamine biosynthesis lipoprotein
MPNAQLRTPNAQPRTLNFHPAPGWRSIEFDPETRTVFLPHGVEIDLGATAKALASDTAATAALQEFDGGGVLVSLGGDIAVAGSPPQDGWVIQVSEDSTDSVDAAAERIAFTRGGVATSSTQVRSWSRNGRRVHHIVDPKTGMPAGGPWRLVTVVAESCVMANVASTAAVVRGRAILPWLTARGMPSRLVGDDGEIVRMSGWPEVPGTHERRA